MAYVIKLKAGESIEIDGEYKVLAKSVRNGITTLIIISLGEAIPVIKRQNSEDHNEGIQSK